MSTSQDVKEFIKTQKEDGFNNIIILATPNADSEITGQIMAIQTRKKEGLAMICGAISAMCESDPDKEMEALDIIKSAFEDKNKIIKNIKKTKKETKKKLEELLKDLLED